MNGLETNDVETTSESAGPRNPEAYVKLIEEYFITVDKDKSADITEEEIEKFLERDDLTHDVREAFSVMDENFSVFTGLGRSFWAPKGVSRNALLSFSQATHDEVVDDTFWPRAIFGTTFSLAASLAVTNGIRCTIAGGPVAGLSCFLSGAASGALVGLPLGAHYAWTASENRESIKSINYFDLKESRGTYTPGTRQLDSSKSLMDHDLKQVLLPQG